MQTAKRLTQDDLPENVYLLLHIRLQNVPQSGQLLVFALINLSDKPGIQLLGNLIDRMKTWENTDGLSLGQIAKHVELPRSTVQRIVSALPHEGFEPTGSKLGESNLAPRYTALHKHRHSGCASD